MQIKLSQVFSKIKFDPSYLCWNALYFFLLTSQYAGWNTLASNKCSLNKWLSNNNPIIINNPCMTWWNGLFYSTFTLMIQVKSAKSASLLLRFLMQQCCMYFYIVVIFFVFFLLLPPLCVCVCACLCVRDRDLWQHLVRTACDMFATMQTQRLHTVARTLTHAYPGVHGVARAICWMTGCLESGWGEGEVERGWSGEGRQRCGGEDKLDAQKQTVFVPEGRWLSACATIGRAAL